MKAEDTLQICSGVNADFSISAGNLAVSKSAAFNPLASSTITCNVTSKGMITMKGGKIIGNIDIDTTGKLTLEDGEITGDITNAGTVVVKDEDFSFTGSITNNGTLEFSGSTTAALTALGTVTWGVNSTISLKDGSEIYKETVEQSISIDAISKLTADSVTLAAGQTLSLARNTADPALVVTNAVNAAAATITVDMTGATADSYTLITGGDGSDYGTNFTVVGAGYTLSQSGNNLIATRFEAVASVTDKNGKTLCYASVQEAIAAINASGMTLKLLSDVEDAVALTTAKSDFTFDLNGFDYVNTSDGGVTTDKKITITDSTEPETATAFTVKNIIGKGSVAVAGNVALDDMTSTVQIMAWNYGALSADGLSFNNSLLSSGDLYVPDPIVGRLITGTVNLKDSSINVTDDSKLNKNTIAGNSYNNAVWFQNNASVTDVTIDEAFASKNSGVRVSGVTASGLDASVEFVTNKGKTTAISIDRDKTKTSNSTGWTYGITVGNVVYQTTYYSSAGQETIRLKSSEDNASLTFRGAGDLAISGNVKGGGDAGSPYGYTLVGVNVNGRDNVLTFANEGKTTITESGAYGVNGVLNNGTANFTDGTVLINTYLDGGVGLSDNVGLYNAGNESSIKVTDGVDEMTIFTEGAAYKAVSESGNISSGAAAMLNNSYGGFKTTIDAKKLNVLVVSGEDTNKEWTIGDTTVTGHTKYDQAKATEVGAGKNSATYGILNAGSDSIIVGPDTVTNIHTRDNQNYSVAVGAEAYTRSDGYKEINGKVEILGDTTILAEGGSDTKALYAADGNAIVVGSEGKTVNITGDIVSIGSATNVDEQGQPLYDAIASSITIQGSTNTITGNIEAADGAEITFANTVTVIGDVVNGGLINFAGTMDLQTSTDKWNNAAGSTVNWDLTGGTTQYGSITHFEQYTNENNTVMQTITVKADQAAGEYVLATGDFDITKLTENKSTAFIVHSEVGTDTNIIVNGGWQAHGEQGYKLSLVESADAGTDDQLVLTVASVEDPSLTVTTLDDVVDAYDGVVSLREAIAYAAAGTTDAEGKYTITFDYATLGDTFTIELDAENGALTISENAFSDASNPLTIVADTGKSVTIDGGDKYDGSTVTTHSGTRIMSIKSGNNVKLNNLTLTNAYCSGLGGGAISNAGTLTIENSTFTGNKVLPTSGSGDGGAIYNTGTLTVKNGTFTDNEAKSSGNCFGGAISNYGTLNVTGSTFTGNAAKANGSNAIGNGGAISNDGTLNISDSTFTGNTAMSPAASKGGAIYTTTKKSSSVQVNIGNCTFTGNSATLGGAVYAFANGGKTATATIADSTFTGNTATTAGEAIYNLAWASKGATSVVTVNLVNDIIVGNGTGAGVVNAQQGAGGTETVTTNGYGVNIVDSDSTSAITTPSGSTTTPATKDAVFVIRLDGEVRTDADGVPLLKKDGAADGKGVYVYTDDAGNFGWKAQDGDAISWISGDTHDNPVEITVKGTEDKPNAGSGATFSGMPKVTYINETGTAVEVTATGLFDFDTTKTIALSAGTYVVGADYNGDGKIDATDAALGKNTFTVSNTVSSTAGDVKLILADGFTLNVETGTDTAISSASGSTITIYGQANGSGVLNSRSTGSDGISNSGKLTVIGGTINASGTTGHKAINNQGAVSFAETLVLANATDTWSNAADTTVNWDLTAGTTHYGAIGNFQYYSNADATVMQTITVTADQAAGEYVLATGDMTTLTGKDTFYVTIDGQTLSGAITVGAANPVVFEDNRYSLAVVPVNGNADAKLVLTVAPNFGVSVDEALEGKWFKKDETITLTGSYVSEETPSITVDGSAATVNAESKTWSYTYTNQPADTKGKDVTIAITDGTQSADTTYTLKVDTVAPAITSVTLNGTEYAGEWKSVKPSEAVVTVTLNDATSGIKASSLNIIYDGAVGWTEGKHYTYDADTGVITVKQGAITEGAHVLNINVNDNAGNALTGASQNVAVKLDVTAPKISDVTFSGGYYDEANTRYWFKQDAEATVTAKITDANSGVATTDFNGIAGVKGAGASKDIYTFTLDTATEENYDAKKISATDNAGNEGESAAAYNYGIDGTGPTISVTKTPTSLSSTVTVTATVSDGAGSGVKETFYSMDDGTSWTAYTQALSVTQNSKILFKATDNVGNVSTQASYVTDLEAITLTAASDSKTYDGTALTDSGYTFNEAALVAGDELFVTVEGSLTDAGTAANKVTSYKVMRGDTDVTADYTFADTVDGTLTVTKRSVSLESGTARKEYDGTALTDHEVIVGGDGFAADEGAVYTFTASQTEVGSSNNFFTYMLNAGTKAANYTITEAIGTLTVTPKGAKVEPSPEPDPSGKTSLVVAKDETRDIYVETVEGLDATVVNEGAQKLSVGAVTATGQMQTPNGEAKVANTGAGDMDVARVTGLKVEIENSGTGELAIEWVMGLGVEIKNDSSLAIKLAESITDITLVNSSTHTFTGALAGQRIFVKDATTEGRILDATLKAGTISFEDRQILENVTLNGAVTVAAGAVITLEGTLTGSDGTTIANAGTLNWDLTDGETTKLAYSLMNGNTGTLAITVDAQEQDIDSYTLVTGYTGTDMNNWTLKGTDGQSFALTVGGDAVKMGERIYTLAKDKKTNDLVLDVVATVAPELSATTLSEIAFDTSSKTVKLLDETATVKLMATDEFSNIAAYSTDGGKTWTKTYGAVAHTWSRHFDVDLVPDEALTRFAVKDAVGNIGYLDFAAGSDTLEIDLADFKNRSFKFDKGDEIAFGFKTMTGTEKNDTVSFGADSTVRLFGGEVDFGAGTNKITVEKNADVAFLGEGIENVTTVNVNAGGTVKSTIDGVTATRQAVTVADFADLSFSEGKTATLKTGKYTAVTTGDIEADVTRANTVSIGANATFAAGDVDGFRKITVASGAKHGRDALDGSFAKNEQGVTTFTAGDITTTAKGDTLSFGNFNDVTLESVSTLDGNDTLKIGNYSDVTAKSLDFGDGKDTLSVGKGSTLTVDDLDVNDLEKLSIGKESTLYLGADSFAEAQKRAETDKTWAKYLDAGQIAAIA